MMTEEEIQERLVEIARAESAEAQAAIAELQDARDTLYNFYVAKLDQQLEMIKTFPDKLRQCLKADFMAHVDAGGDPAIHALVEFRRSTSYEYDKKAALEFVLANDLPFVRIKKELDANAFKKAVQAGEIDYPDGEMVNSPTVAIGKLGHLLIIGQENEK